jgi:hypothetical protein
MKVGKIIKYRSLEWHECNLCVTKLASRRIYFPATRDILRAVIWLFVRFVYWHGPLHVSKCVFHRNVNLNTPGVHSINRWEWWHRWGSRETGLLELGERSYSTAHTRYHTHPKQVFRYTHGGHAWFKHIVAKQNMLYTAQVCLHTWYCSRSPNQVWPSLARASPVSPLSPVKGMGPGVK